MTRALDELGVGEITVPGGAAYREQKDFVHWCKTHGIKAAICGKGPGMYFPARSDWREVYKRHIDMGADNIVPIFVFGAKNIFSDFGEDLSKDKAVEVIQEVVRFAKEQGATVIWSFEDALRTKLDTALRFYKAGIEAGADGIYVWDSRGNTHPAAAAYFVSQVRAAIGKKPLCIQFHNDIGLATANCLMAVENGANWLDASILGIGDRGGCVSLEEAATSLELYGVHTGIKLEKLHETCKLVESAFGVKMHPWKPIMGDAWPAEPGWGHWGPGDLPETPMGLSPDVVGRHFENVVAPTVFFGRYPTFVTDFLNEWGYKYTAEDVAEIIERAKSSIMTHQAYIDIREFQELYKGVLGIA